MLTAETKLFVMVSSPRADSRFPHSFLARHALSHALHSQQPDHSGLGGRL